MILWLSTAHSGGFPGGSMVKNLPANQRCRFNTWVGKISWRRKWQTAPVFLPGKSHGQRSLVGYNPQYYKELDRTELLRVHAYFIKIKLVSISIKNKIKWISLNRYYLEKII